MTFVFSEDGTLRCTTNNEKFLIKESTDICVESDITIKPNKIYKLVNGEIIETDFISDEDIILNSQWTSIREQRNKLLQETDWIVVKSNENGNPIPEEWKTYRQSLRDITNQLDPDNIVWPIKPS